VTTIAHLSDLHFGRIDPHALNSLRAVLGEIAPDLLLITGDLTQSGRRREFEEAGRFLRSLDCPFFAVPGNHDAPVYNLAARFFDPWGRFRRHIGESGVAAFENEDVLLIGVNTARRAAPRLNWSYGKLRRRDIRAAAAEAAAESGGRLVAIAAHHPFEKGAGRAGAEPVGRAGIALEAFAEAGVDAVMTGHVHATKTTPLAAVGGRILSIGAGSAVSTRQRGEAASFLVLSPQAPPKNRRNEKRLGCVPYTLGSAGFERGPMRVFAKSNGAWRERAGDEPA